MQNFEKLLRNTCSLSCSEPTHCWLESKKDLLDKRFQKLKNRFRGALFFMEPCNDCLINNKIKLNNKNTGTRTKIYSKLTIKTRTISEICSKSTIKALEQCAKFVQS